MSLNLVSNRIVKGKLYPALTEFEARPYTTQWRLFGSHYPYTVPLRLQEYCDYHGIALNLYTLDQSFPVESFYPIGLAFFNFEIDYFSLLPELAYNFIRHNKLRILFYYHEGDNPHKIKLRLDQLLQQHNLPENCYVFVSANTAARNVTNFVYFADFELWYWQRNHNVPPTPVSNNKIRDFTALNRLHKSWRATAMADLQSQSILDNSWWSYCESGQLEDSENPIEIDSIPGLRSRTNEFLLQAPYFSDSLSQDDRNNHAISDSKYYTDSYCNIVLETHFDADQSGGAFVTEKTFKPIKHGQLFFIAGPAGSLQVLRDLGYRTFDHVLDNRYDQENNNTQRWRMLCAAIKAAQPDLPKIFAAAQPDIEYNQQLFQALKTQRLNNLIEEINAC